MQIDIVGSMNNGKGRGFKGGAVTLQGAAISTETDDHPGMDGKQLLHTGHIC